MSDPVNNTPGTSNPDPTNLTAEAVIAQLRTMRSQIANVAPLSKEQRKLVQRRLRVLPPPVVEASISVIGSSNTVAQAVGQPLGDVLQLQSDSVHWNLVADELRSFLKGIEGANLLRRDQLAFIASQAYLFGSQLARSPVNADLVPQVEEIKRLKTLARRKKATQNPPPPSPAHETSTPPKNLE
jgi:hypothetical protein